MKKICNFILELVFTYIVIIEVCDEIKKMKRYSFENYVNEYSEKFKKKYSKL